MTEVTDLTLSQILHDLRAGTRTSLAITQAYLDRIDRIDGTLRAYLNVTRERALAAAAAADAARAAGDDRPLLGVPLALKDVLSTKGIETTCGSKILKGYHPVFSATVVEHLEAAGMV
ncbi:MAG: Asp-tRNA(Asn)/Glu-tRNA(Gln) amidotransferase GatCAB subunit A, partial [Anaerolineae bacterium]|nr:Asp-tRNA(Asn)/Glu-tRNA(Gln) amidotransferase GatCAB subunit A [Anaerolineae bacterium]